MAASECRNAIALQLILKFAAGQKTATIVSVD